MRLVGLSRPFFVPRRGESMKDYGMADQADATARSSGEADEGAREHVQHHPAAYPPTMTPATGVNTPGTMKGPPRTEFPMRIDGPSDSEEKPGPGVSIVSEEDSERNATDGKEEDKTIRVLVVEDNQINQKLVVKVLQLEKVQEISVAEDGPQAADKVKEVMAKDEKFDIIFMDIQVLSFPLPMVLC